MTKTTLNLAEANEQYARVFVEYEAVLAGFRAGTVGVDEYFDARESFEAAKVAIDDADGSTALAARRRKEWLRSKVAS